ncbi:MAG TPA: outer membrane protein transport protein, partial [Labilithrix sp.]|nr:outer membrane protein transport protein [Labilithrix sp.]
GLAGQPTRITLQNGLIFEHTCMTRVRAAGDTTDDPLAPPGGTYPRVCNDIKPTINPQIGATIRVSDRLGIGLLVIGPSSGGEKTFPDFVNDGTGTPQASPQRYLLVAQSGIILFPTVGVGYEVFENLRLGASFSWGFARLKLTSATVSLNTDSITPAKNDTRATIQAHDYFVPGFTVGGIYSATPEIDVAGWYKWSDAIRARGDVGTAANYYSKDNALGNSKGVRYGDTIYPDCGTGLATTQACAGGQNGTVKFVLPMEAKLGFRYHKRRGAVPALGPEATPEELVAASRAKHLRDPLATDVFDVEADLTWANNSAADNIQIRFPGDATGKGSLPVAGVAGGEIPPNADQQRGFKDVFGVRVGGDYNVLPDQLAIRGGAFFESSAAEAAFQNIDFAPTSRFGLALGGTYRLHLGQGEKTSAIELMLGYSHIFFGEQSRTDPGASGSPALAGTSCNGSDPVVGTQTCSDGNARYRTKWPVNLGTITSSVNVINVGAAYRF